MIERAVLDQLNQHCTYNNIHPVIQSAYKGNHSCETALLKFANNMLWAMEHTQVTALVALDASAVFDTVNLVILLKDLEKKVWNNRWCIRMVSIVSLS